MHLKNIQKNKAFFFDRDGVLNHDKGYVHQIKSFKWTSGAKAAISFLNKLNFKVIVVTRNIHQKGHIIKTQGNAGYIDIVEANIFDEAKIKSLFEGADICINLIGILYEKKRSSFKNIHTLFPSLLARLSKQNKLKHLIHLSALGVSEATESAYARSKLDGEKEILKNFPLSTILRPSVVYSVDDNFTTNFMTLLNRLPVFPLYYNGQTKFMPIHSSDLVDIIFNISMRFKEFFCEAKILIVVILL